jgi:DNA-3-methyladenine glycosylase II
MPMLCDIGAGLPLIDSSLQGEVAPSIGAGSTRSHSRHELSVGAPFRLDLTVSALRRLSTNIVDVLASDGQYIRAFETSRGPVVARVAQVNPEALAVTLDGDSREHKRALALVKRMLGIDRDVAYFSHAAEGIPWLSPLAQRMRGVRPPRYPTLWEACVNAIVFQQISLHAASAIMRRLILALGRSVDSGGVAVYAFPTNEAFLGAEDDVLRAAGLSLGKFSTVRRVAEALSAGVLEEAMLEERASPDAAALLCGIKGIGPWTATVILLRGLGRLDVFPMNDSSVARNLSLVSSQDRIDVESTLDSLSPQQGMLYYHLLLARLEARDDLGRASGSMEIE